MQCHKFDVWRLTHTRRHTHTHSRVLKLCEQTERVATGVHNKHLKVLNMCTDEVLNFYWHMRYLEGPSCGELEQLKLILFFLSLFLLQSLRQHLRFVNTKSKKKKEEESDGGNALQQEEVVQYRMWADRLRKRKTMYLEWNSKNVRMRPVTSAKVHSHLLWFHLLLRPSFLERCGLLKSMRQSVASEMGVKDLIGELLIAIEDTPPTPSSSSSSTGTPSLSLRRSMTSLRREHKNAGVLVTFIFLSRCAGNSVFRPLFTASC